MLTNQRQPALLNGEHKVLTQIEQELIKANPVLFHNIPEHQKAEILRAFSMSLSVEQVVERKITAYQGPLPHWEDLKKYGQIIPNGPERIMAMSERQQQHRQALEMAAVKEQLAQSRRGQIFGLIIGMTVIIGGILCVMTGHEWSGANIGGSGLTGLVSVFVIGKRRQAKSLDEKTS